MKRRLSLLPLTVFSVFFFLLSWYVLVGLKTIAYQAFVPIAFWIVIIVSLGALFYALQGIRTRGMGQFFKLSTHFFLVLFVSEVLFALLVFAGDAYRGIYGLINLVIKDDFLSPARNPYWIAAAAVFFCRNNSHFHLRNVKGKVRL